MTFDFTVKEFILGGGTGTPTLQFYRRGFNLGGGSSPTWKDVILSGNTALMLVNAKANGLNYLKLFGKCEQDGTPTPSSPVDIVCNNGTLKVRHQSGLPLGYQPYEYLTANGNKWLNTGVQLASTDIIETEFKNNSSSGYGALYGVFALGNSSAFYANGTYYGYNVANDKVNTGISVDTEWHTLRQDFGNGVITFDGNDTTYTPFEFENTNDNYLFARYYNNSYGYGFKGSCKRFKVIRNGVLICDLIPVVQLSDNEIGMYDLVNNVFRGNLGTGDFDISNPINDLEIYIDGTVETVAIKNNIFTLVGATYDETIGGNGNTGSSSNNGYSDYLAVTGGDVYNFSDRGLSGVALYDQNKVFQSRSSVSAGDYTIPVGIAYIRVNFRQSYMNNISITHTNYTATAEMLLKVGDYQDVQEIKTGAITRNCEALIYDGTQTINTPYISTTGGLDVGAIIVHPKTIPTTESVTPQPMQIQSGDNIVEITQASIDNLELEVSYKAGVEVTVEEIEAVNNDESVEVTVNG